MLLLMIATGGALGSVSRYLAGQTAQRIFGAAFPYGTLTVNLVGSLLMGIAFVILIERMEGEASRLAPFLMTGFLGGFTTFSAFSLDAFLLVESGRFGAAAGYAAVSVLGSLLALAIGIAFARGVLV